MWLKLDSSPLAVDKTENTAMPLNGREEVIFGGTYRSLKRKVLLPLKKVGYILHQVFEVVRKLSPDTPKAAPAGDRAAYRFGAEV